MIRGERDAILRELAEITDNVPYTQPVACEFLFDLVATFDRPEVLEVCCAYGKATAYLAAAVHLGRGHLHAVDNVCRQWNGRSAEELVTVIGAQDSCDIVYGKDARWFLLELFTARPGEWVDLAFLDASHSVEVDAFLALALWTHLSPGGLLLLDDLDWTAAQHAPEARRRTKRKIPHVRVLYDYLCQQNGVGGATIWGTAEQEWPWGIVQKSTSPNLPGIGLRERLQTVDSG